MRQVVIAVVLVGCGGSSDSPDAAKAIDAPHSIDVAPAADAEHTIDAYTPDLACSGSALPTSAPDPLTVSGVVEEVSAAGLTAVANEGIESFYRGDDTSVGSGTSDASGAFTLTVTSGGVAKLGYLHTHDATYLDSYAYNPIVSYANITGAAMPVVTQSTLDLLVEVARVTQSAGNGVMVIRATDCLYKPIAGVAITVTAGQLVYAAGGVPSTSATQTDASGEAFVFNATPGPVEVSGMLGTTVMRSHPIDAYASSTTFTDLQP